VPPKGRTLVVGAGKAAASMAAAAEACWPPDAPLEGLVVTRYGHGLPTRRIRVVEAAHPVPDAAGERAAGEILALARSLGPDDLLVALISGGGSALLTLPAQGISMEALRTTTRDLLRCGAPIQDINAVRKHLSAIQGGRLADACKAPVRALLISDVAGDDPTHIASGPCAADPTTFADALDVLRRFGITAPEEVVRHLERGARGEVAETPKPGEDSVSRAENRVIARSQQSLEAAAAYFKRNGVQAAILGDAVTGEAAEVARAYAALARQVRSYSQPWAPPVALISGGELTVTVRGNGRGGRCSAFLLALGVELRGLGGVHAIACDTDGIDGTEQNAGAVLDPGSMARATALGLSPRASLVANDSYAVFEKLGDLVVTGPTRTNVNDYRAILVV
jgi:glycerate 2-kinase